LVEQKEHTRLTWKLKALLVVTLLAVLFIPYRFWLTQVAELLITEEGLEASDAVMVLSGGSMERVDYGVRLFKEGYAGLFFLSEGEEVIHGLDTKWSDLALPRAVEDGLPEDKIIMVRNSTSTYEEALSSRAEFTKHGARSVILVTEPYHSFRSCRTFRKVFRRQDILFRCRPSPSTWFRPDNWWTVERGLIAVNNEYIKLVFYLIRGYM
jgi:uncharacterized SAM-binding protein YcdF (DUF218 family)